jgi:hypothetical protein
MPLPVVFTLLVACNSVTTVEPDRTEMDSAATTATDPDCGTNTATDIATGDDTATQTATETAMQTDTDTATRTDTDTATQTDTGTGTGTSPTNSVPTEPEVWLAPSVPHTGDDLWAVTTATDADGDVLSYTFVWSLDGVPQPEVTGSMVPGDRVVRGGTWSVSVVASDGEDDSPAGTAQVTVVNSAPSITAVTLTPAEVTTNTVITANVTATDVDLAVGDTLSYTYVWFVDGVPVDGSGPTLDGATAFSKEQTVAVRAIPRDDADAEGPAVTSADVTVLDSPPTAPAVAITPADPVEGDDLTCEIVTPSTDPDGDGPITYVFAWEVDEMPYTHATGSATGSVVGGTDVGSGEAWACAVTAGNGTATAAVATAAVTTAPDCWSLAFDGVSDFLETYDTQESRATTFAMWVKPASTPNRLMGLVTNGGVAEHTITLDIKSGGQPVWAVTDGSYSAASGDTWSGVIGATPVAGGAWTHLAGTWNGSALSLFVNGVSVGTIAEGYPMGRAYTTRFGMNVSGGVEAYFDGQIADIQVYPTALGASDIESLAAHPYSSIAGVEANFLTGSASLTEAVNGTVVAIAHGTSWVADCP